MQYEELGYLPEAMVNFLARLGWAHGDDEVFTRDEFVAWFDLDAISPAPSRFNADKLKWVNQEHMKRLPEDGARPPSRAVSRARRARSGGRARARRRRRAGPRPRRDARRDGRRRALLLCDAAAHAGASSREHVGDANRVALSELAAELAALPWTREALGAAMKAAAARHGLKPGAGDDGDARARLRHARDARDRRRAGALPRHASAVALAASGDGHPASCIGRAVHASACAIAIVCAGSRPVEWRFPELVAHDQVRLRDRRRRFLPGEGHRRRLTRRDPRLARRPRHPSQARPVHQRRSWNDESVPARRGVRHRGRRRDRPRPRPLRALHRREDGPAQQLHDRPDLRERDPQGAPRRLPRRHRAGHPAHHRRDQELDQAARRIDGRRPRSRRRGRRHGRRHRVAAVPRSDPADGHHARPRQRLLHPPDARAVHRGRRRDEDQADAALGEGAARDRHPARRRAVPRRPAAAATATGARSRCSPTSRPTR